MEHWSKKRAHVACQGFCSSVLCGYLCFLEWLQCTCFQSSQLNAVSTSLTFRNCLKDLPEWKDLHTAEMDQGLRSPEKEKVAQKLPTFSKSWEIRSGVCNLLRSKSYLDLVSTDSGSYKYFLTPKMRITLYICFLFYLYLCINNHYALLIKSIKCYEENFILIIYLTHFEL